MPITINGTGTIIGISAGGLPDGVVQPADLSTGAPSWTSGGDLSFNSGYGSAATAYGCRAWVNFNGTTASPSTIRGSGNVSSVTKNGTGDYTVNFTTAMVDSSYSVVSTAQRGDSTAGGIIGQVQGTTSNTYTSITTTSARIRTINVAEATVDPLCVCVAIFR